MAYASKYYDPVKAHEYYMKNRELKGYENRYGGSRGDGTSAASTNSKKTSTSKKQKSSEIDPVKQHNESIKNEITQLKANAKREIESINDEIKNLQKDLRGMSAEDKRKNRELVEDRILALRKKIQGIRDDLGDKSQSLRETTKGGSTSGFNQKGKEAAEYIKKKMEDERKEITKKTNKEIDKNMLKDAKQLKKEVEAARKSGIGFSRQQFRNRLNKLVGNSSKIKQKTLAKHKKEYAQKYKDEIDKLRSDKSMYTYYENRDKQRSERAKREAEQAVNRNIQRKMRREQERKRLAKQQEREAKKREREAKKQEREARKREREARKQERERERELKRQQKASRVRVRASRSTDDDDE